LEGISKMVEPYKFGPNQIDHHEEKIGIDIRPIIEYKLEREKLFDFGNKLVDKYPNLFESLVQSPNDFHIRKKFIFPGKGEIDLLTLGVTSKGPVFVIPRVVSLFEEETQLGRSEDIVIDIIKIFQKSFPTRNIFRVGQVNEYIFSTGAEDSTKLLAERFTNKISIPPNGELKIRINVPNDDYNRIIEMEPAKKIEAVPEIPGQTHVKGFGIKVVVDFNNRDMSQNLEKSRILSILHDSSEYNRGDLYKFLNRSD